MRGLWSIGFVACLLACQIDILRSQAVDDRINYFKPGITVQEILTTRGYKAETHYFITEDNYQIELIRGTNPLINDGRSGRADKLPILFIHGIFMGSVTWLVKSQGAVPRLYDSNVDLSTISSEQLYELVKDDPARHSLPLLEMNMGYEVWFLNRRGFTPGSRRKVGRRERTVLDAIADVPATLFDGGFSLMGGLEPGRPSRVPIMSLNYTSYNSSTLDQVRPSLADILSFFSNSFLEAAPTAAKLLQILTESGDVRQQFIDTFDAEFWDFSADEQVAYDFPGAIDTVLKISGAPKLHIVSYSFGGAVSILGLSHKPELAYKVSRHVSFQPSMNLGSRMSIDYMLSFIQLLVQGYTGPIPFVFQVEPLSAVLQQVCSTEVAQRTYCEAVADSLAGFSAGQEAIIPTFLSIAPSPTCIGELISLSQYARTEVPCMRRHNTEAMNLAKYGQKDPPCYDLGRIILGNMSIYSGRDDTLVAPDAIATTISQMRVPVELNLIGDKKVRFNHLGNAIHDANDKLALLPAFIDIERSNAVDVRNRRW